MLNEFTIMPKVYVIILNYNGWKDTIACLESVLKLHYVNYSIIVIDNCSSDSSISKIVAWAQGTLSAFNENSDLNHLVEPPQKKPISFRVISENHILQKKEKSFHKELVIIKADSNRGFSAGNNIGIKYALSQEDVNYFWILNNDTLVCNDTLDELVAYHLKSIKKRKVGIVGGVLLYYDRPDTVQCLGGASYNSYLGLVRQYGNGSHTVKSAIESNNFLDYISGACMLISEDFINEVGLLSEEYFLYYEEIDWCKRGKAKGWQIDYSPTANIFHKEGGTISKGSSKVKSHLSDYCFLRSKLLYTRKNESILCNITVYISVVFSFFIRIYKGQFDRLSTMLKIAINPTSRFFLSEKE